MIAKEVAYCKQRCFEYAEKPGKLLSNLITPQNQIKAIPVIKNNMGRMINSEEDKITEFVKYYKKLCGTSKPDKKRITEFLDNINIPSLSGERL